MAYSEDNIALAAEYALGTLDADERVQVATMMAVDQEFAAIVQAWQFRLGVLNQMVGTIEPRPIVWENIKREIAQTISTQDSYQDSERDSLEAPPVLVDAPPPPLPELSSSELSSPKSSTQESSTQESSTQEPSTQELSSPEQPSQQAPLPDVQPPAPPQSDSDVIPDIAPQFIPQTHAPDPRIVPLTQVPVADDTKVIYLESRVKRWRTIASAVGALAAALLVTLSLQILSPDALPGALRPAPRIQTVEVKTPPAPSSLPAQYVALLQGQSGGPAFILTIDGATKNFTVRKVGATPEPGKSFELWLISDKLPRPRSLGVIGAGDFTARPVLAGYDADVVNGATYAITVEQPGGSPSGQPTSAPVFSGKLIETVPPSQPQVPAKK
ncbi:anti-sigma factor [Bradyrhizobium sp. WYCCWR 13023]|uniref:Anti-sigma factor n=1 Tax=Bradyrhizobium zhengyangense TaxID=2911009 RepID=A0A9X1RK32_9BRAD|nr:anti-sigma factor [Bradyrhizobium zhengyangense]MCG2632838.1 anti-sigma factor [Bradyrhizobium zhengyangense]MCG2645613.1 anti-sigma factor [Bradyrhizobium zhengyangense]